MDLEKFTDFIRDIYDDLIIREESEVYYKPSKQRNEFDKCVYRMVRDKQRVSVKNKVITKESTNRLNGDTWLPDIDLGEQEVRGFNTNNEYKYELKDMTESMEKMREILIGQVQDAINTDLYNVISQACDTFKQLPLMGKIKIPTRKRRFNNPHEQSIGWLFEFDRLFVRVCWGSLFRGIFKSFKLFNSRKI